jgi:hypothetical protein
MPDIDAGPDAGSVSELERLIAAADDEGVRNATSQAIGLRRSWPGLRRGHSGYLLGQAVTTAVRAVPRTVTEFAEDESLELEALIRGTSVGDGHEMRSALRAALRLGPSDHGRLTELLARAVAYADAEHLVPPGRMSCAAARRYGGS